MSGFNCRLILKLQTLLELLSRNIIFLFIPVACFWWKGIHLMFNVWS